MSEKLYIRKDDMGEINRTIIQAAIDRSKREKEDMTENGLSVKNEKKSNQLIEENTGYVIIITCEDERYDRGEITLDYFSEHPWEGTLVAVLYGKTVDDFFESDYEGFFYQLYKAKDGKRIGYGVINYEVLEEDIRISEGVEKAKLLLKSLGKIMINMITLKISEPWGAFLEGTHISMILQWIELVCGVPVDLKWIRED